MPFVNHTAADGACQELLSALDFLTCILRYLIASWPYGMWRDWSKLNKGRSFTFLFLLHIPCLATSTKDLHPCTLPLRLLDHEAAQKGQQAAFRYLGA